MLGFVCGLERFSPEAVQIVCGGIQSLGQRSDGRPFADIKPAHKIFSPQLTGKGNTFAHDVEVTAGGGKAHAVNGQHGNSQNYPHGRAVALKLFLHLLHGGIEPFVHGRVKQAALVAVGHGVGGDRFGVFFIDLVAFVHRNGLQGQKHVAPIGNKVNGRRAGPVNNF